tara:strand:- start:151 stop:387 length:237 start_codon:yes stop_codon:yes gene_type:complete
MIKLKKLLKESSRMFDQESGEVMKLRNGVDDAIDGRTLKKLVREHPDPKVRKLIKQVMPLLKKSSKLLDDIYEEVLGT